MFGLFGNHEKEIERAKSKLIYDLQHNGIKNLLINMDRHETYSPFIDQRRSKGSYDSEDHISMIAYRVSTTLSDPNYKQELLQLLNDSEFDAYRKYIFWCLASLCSNTNDYELFDFLLEQIEIERDESIIVAVLSRLDKIVKPKDKDISVIKKYLVEGTADTQRAAIKALSNSKHEEVEDLLLNEFKIADRHVKGMICTPLFSVATTKAIPILQTAYKQTRDPFLRHQIECVLDEINKRTNSTANIGLLPWLRGPEASGYAAFHKISYAAPPGTFTKFDPDSYRERHGSKPWTLPAISNPHALTFLFYHIRNDKAF